MDDLRRVYALRIDDALRDASPEIKSRADQAKQLLRQHDDPSSG